MDKKALVLDIDGTLVNSKKEITPKTLEALQKLMKEGHALLLASGRPTPGMKRYRNELELDRFGGYILSFNGARVTECATDKVIYQQTLPQNVPGELYEYAKAHGAGIISYEKETVLSAFEPDEYIQLEAKINNIPVKVVPNFPDYIDFPVNKCLLTAPGPKAAEMEKELIGIYGESLSIYRSEEFFLEVMPKGVSKAETLDHILDIIGVTRENTICCGDGYNDISMIKYAGIGVAMSNAREEVRAAADFIAGSNDEDGLLPVIEKLVGVETGIR